MNPRGEKSTMTAGKMRTAIIVLLSGTLAVFVAACGGGSSSSSGFSSGNPDIKGQQITVLLPYSVPQDILAQFTERTGVEVKLDVVGFDAIHSKLIVANNAQTSIADVTEFDWSFTGQFAAAGWYEPLENALPKATLSDLGNTNAPFEDSAGHLYASCANNDFELTIYNAKQLAAAGVSKFPETLADLDKVNQQIKASGAAPYPMSIAMASTEGGVTPWFLLTLAFGGQLFDESLQPQFAEPNSPALKALEFEVDAVKKGYVSPGSVTTDDLPAFNSFTAGQAAISLAISPGALPVANDPKQSTVAGSVKGALVPGVNGPGASFGLPEGLGIPVTSSHKDAALAFIKWWEEPKTQVALYEKAGLLPCGGKAIAELSQTGRLQSGDVIIEEIKHVQPLFPGGAPEWYAQFSSDAQGLINSAIKGDISPQDALQQLSDQATQLAQGG